MIGAALMEVLGDLTEEQRSERTVTVFLKAPSDDEGGVAWEKARADRVSLTGNTGLGDGALVLRSSSTINLIPESEIHAVAIEEREE